ncbi:hypothetical protein JOC95_000094 [Bacillus tianshenii]|uniref:Uncharacterized protein n=1 Tax=Sutcliffiella tianshenii TaxID=1463404 RepID=A0ABS2NUD8_9BACI|nr:hypothetical protein [Bacillus tianshenii]
MKVWEKPHLEILDINETFFRCLPPLSVGTEEFNCES